MKKSNLIIFALIIIFLVVSIYFLNKRKEQERFTNAITKEEKEIIDGLKSGNLSQINITNLINSKKLNTDSLNNIISGLSSSS